MNITDTFLSRRINAATFVISSGVFARSFLASWREKLIKKSTANRILLLIMVALSTLIFSTTAFAARPLMTDDTGTVEKGKFQLEAGFDFARQDNHDRELSPSLTLTYGVLERMDVAIGSGYLFEHPTDGKRENGFADTEVKVKYRWVDEKDWLPSFACTGKLKIPTASESRGLGSGKADFSINAILTKNISKRLVLHLNLGHTFIGEHGGDNEFNYSAAGQFVLSDKWALVGELVGVNNFNGRNDDPFSGLLGTYYLITDNIVWDAGVEIGMTRAAPDFRLTTGLTLFFKP
ncbi:MAG: transporter [Thermodesulfobacteriota bacterium]